MYKNKDPYVYKNKDPYMYKNKDPYVYKNKDPHVYKINYKSVRLYIRNKFVYPINET